MSFFSVNTLKPSREFYESRPPYFVGFSVIAVAVTLVAGLAFLWFFEMEEVVRGHAVIRPWDNTSVVRSRTGGEVVKVPLMDGDRVEKGDVLLSVDVRDQLDRIEEIVPRVERRRERRQRVATLLAAFASDEPNPFLVSEEPRFHEEYVSLDAERSRRRAELNETELELTRELAKPEEYRAEGQIERLRRRLETQRYGKETWAAQRRAELHRTLEELQEEIASLDTELSLLRRQGERGTVLAPIDGYLRELRELNPGDHVAENETVYEVIPTDEEKLRVRVEIPPHEVAELREGMALRVRFESLPPREYGFIEGELTKIPADGLVGDDRPPVFYLEGEIPPSVTREHGDGDTEVHLRPGMTGEGRVIRRESRILVYFMRVLDWVY